MKHLFVPKEFADRNNLIFFGADYRLLHPSTGFSIIEDVKSLFSFLANPSFSSTYLPHNIKLDISKIAVAGYSGGGYPARAAGIYATPRPRAILSVFGMGGDVLHDHWLKPRPSLLPVTRDEDGERRLLSNTTKPVADYPFKMNAEGKFDDSEGRMGMLAHHEENGTFLDGLVGRPISEKLRILSYEQRYAAVPEEVKPLLLEHHLDVFFPPTVFVHGKEDRSVLVGESERTYQNLQQLGVRTKLLVLEGADHGFVPAGRVGRMQVTGTVEVLAKALQFVLEELHRL
ncbi:hypothetical protein HDV00_001227 [Rhizophlyctis rosea]|nr:hypothetical protein HDV00_001227 [Rhizophlyctis rosea]